MNLDRKEYRLSVKSTGLMSELAFLTIQNGVMEVVAQNYAVLEITLPEGIYKVTLKLNEQVLERMIMLNGDINEEIPTPKIYSSMVSEGFTSSREDYSRHAVTMSRKPTIVFDKKETGTGSIFIFFRHPDKSDFSTDDHQRESMGQRFLLLDSDRKVLCQLAGDLVKENQNEGWMAFNAHVNPGIYFLYYEGVAKDPAREIPLMVYRDWQLQLFCTFLNGPQFPSLKVMINPMEQGFMLDDPDNYILDGILQKMHNGIYFMPKNTFLSLVDHHWQQPVKGLLAAYIYYLNKKQSEYELPDDAIDRLSALLGKDAPDVKALMILRALHNHTTIPDVSIDRPCLFLAGMKTAIAKAIAFPEKQIFLENSVAEEVIDRLYTDMIWTSYLPVSAPKANIEKATKPKLEKPEILSSRLAESILYFVDKSLININKLKNCGSNGYLNDGLSVNDLSKALNVTRNMVQHTIAQIVRDKESIVSYGNQVNKNELSEIFSRENIDKLNNIY